MMLYPLLPTMSMGRECKKNLRGKFLASLVRSCASSAVGSRSEGKKSRGDFLGESRSKLCFERGREPVFV